jgi:formamidopyrimidine-DNA glycosylase
VLAGKWAKRVERLGVEPLTRAFKPEALRSLLARSRLPVKPFLMDQDRVAGIGNIMASESLFEAKVHPARPANRVSEVEVRRLHAAIRKVLRRTLARARAPEVQLLEDGAENTFRVYGR